MSGDLNRRLKRWPSWALMFVVLVAFVAVGATRATGPQTPQDRVDEITQRIACPVCDGESVFESQNNSSRGIRNRVEELVRENELSDDEIISEIDDAFGAELLLVPRASGLDALAWALPAAGLVIGLAGLTVAFRRWRDEAAALADPTDADRELVDAALAAEDDPPVESGTS